MKVQPLHDRIVIKREEEELHEVGGIIIPDTAKEKPQRGKIIAIGKGKILDNGNRLSLDVKVGDRVIFSKYSGTEFKIEDEEFIVVREEDILAIIE